MPVFAVLETEEIVQEKDKTRIDASKCYAVGDSSVDKIEICPDTPSVGTPTYYDVTTDQFLDWQYTHSGQADPMTKTVTLRITDGNDNSTTTLTKTIQVITAATDKLFSTDEKLRKHEPDILKFVPEGRATFKDVHRRAQSLVLAWLDKEGYVDDFGDKLTKDHVSSIEEFQEWATALALKLIFEGNSNAVDDKFSAKAKTYEKLEAFYRDRAVLRLDLNLDGTEDVQEEIKVAGCIVVRR